MQKKKNKPPKPRNPEPAAAAIVDAPPPAARLDDADRLDGRRVKFLAENPFIRELITLYGDLPVDQLVAKWKQDDQLKYRHHSKT